MTIKLVRDAMTKDLEKIKRSLENVPKEMYDYWVKVTPIKSGNAKRKTRLDNKTIVANYPYASQLNDGSSRQAPKGMSEPTEQFLMRRLRQILRK